YILVKRNVVVLHCGFLLFSLLGLSTLLLFKEATIKLKTFLDALLNPIREAFKHFCIRIIKNENLRFIYERLSLGCILRSHARYVGNVVINPVVLLILDNRNNTGSINQSCEITL